METVIGMVLAFLLINRILVWMMPETKTKLATKDNETFMKSLSIRKVAEAIIEYYKSLNKKSDEMHRF